MADMIETADQELMVKLAMDAFHRIIVHYGLWLSETEHQMGLARALSAEQTVWDAGLKNQMTRLGKTLGFGVDEDGIPTALKNLSRDDLSDLLRQVAVNWLANDGIWFQAVEGRYGMNDAKRCNDTCWTRFSPFEAFRIKTLLGLPEQGGLPALKRALRFRLYALINEQSIEEIDDTAFIFRMNNCRVQSARKRRGLPDYPCKSAGMVEYPRFAETIDSRIRTECVGCPPDAHPDEWFCAWKFTMNGA